MAAMPTIAGIRLLCLSLDGGGILLACGPSRGDRGRRDRRRLPVGFLEFPPFRADRLPRPAPGFVSRQAGRNAELGKSGARHPGQRAAPAKALAPVSQCSPDSGGRAGPPAVGAKTAPAVAAAKRPDHFAPPAAIAVARPRLVRAGRVRERGPHGAGGYATV